MKPTYRVRDWDKHFENHESRKVKRSFWVPIPNRHDGKSYRRIAAHADGVAVFAAWILILEAASKMPERGVLADEDGPLDADDLAAMTGFPSSIFEAAFRLLPEDRVGWLEVEEPKLRRRKSPDNAPKSPGASRNLPESPGTPGTSAVELNGTELHDKEQKGKEDSAKAGASAAASPQGSDFTIWRLGAGKLISASGMEEQAARSLLGGLCKTHGKERVAEVVTKMLAQEPADPKTYLVSILQDGNRNGSYKQNSKQPRSNESGVELKFKSRI